MTTRALNLGQAPKDGILVFPDVPPSPLAGYYLGVSSIDAQNRILLGWVNIGTQFLPITGGTLTGPLILFRDPVATMEAVNKRYADTTFLARTGGTMLGPLTLASDPTQPLHASTRQYADTKLALSGGTLTGNLFLNADPTNPTQAATKRYVDNTTSALYLPLAGGTLTGPLTMQGGATYAAGDPRLPPLAYFWQDPTGNIGGAIDLAGTLLWSLANFTTATIGTATINAGTATLTTLNATNSTISGTLTTNNLTASGAITLPLGSSLVLSSLTVSNDVWAAMDPRLSGYVYGFFDPNGAMGGGITYNGTLAWGATQFTNATIGTLTATTASLGTMSLSGALTVSQLTVADATWATLDPRIPGLSYAWLDPSGAVGVGIGFDGTFQAGYGNFSTSLVLGFDATQPGHALRKSYADIAYINSSGGTMTGALHLPSVPPTAPGDQAVNKDYVDSAAASGGAGGLTGLVIQKDYPYPPLRDPKRDYGAIGDGVTDDTSPVMACAHAAIAAGERLIAINDTFNVPNLTFDVCDVIPVGSGKLITHPLGPNIWVAPPFAPTPPRRINRTFDMPIHAPHTTQLLRTNQPVVAVVTGESTGAPTPNGFTSLANTWGRLPPAFNAANPGKNITWYNRAIGGQRWSNLNTVVANPETTVAWYTDTSRAWLLYIQDLAPDIVFIELAGNDGPAFDINNMLSVIAKLKAFPKVPDIVVVTSNPYAQHYATRTTFNVFENQCSTAMLEKSWFITHGMGVIDSFRTSVLSNRGIDLDDMPLLKDTIVTGGDIFARKMIPLPFTWPTRCWGYGGIFYVNVNSWAALGGEIQFPIGSHSNTNANAGSLLRVGRDNATGNLYYSVDVTRVAAGASNDINFIPRTVVPGWTCGTGNMSFFLSIVGSKLALYSGNQNDNPLVDQYTIAFTGDIPRFAMPFQPVITCTAGTVINALYFEKAGDNYATALSANPHPRTTYMPLMTDMEDHGNLGTSGPQVPQGGFGVGHDSVFKGIYARASCIDSCNFSAGA